MIRRLAVLVAALLMFAATSLVSAQAATVIYYSKESGSYGWCAGYSYSKGESCARDSCSQYGGTNCELAAECEAGWSATAFAESPDSGFGATCGWKNAASARTWANVACMLASQTWCHIDSTFDGNGNERSKRENDTFDQTWLAQVLLDFNGSDAGIYDGQMGPKTAQAIKDFQKKMGVAETGTIDDALLTLMKGAMGGVGVLVDRMKNDPKYIGPVPKDTFSYSATPRPLRDAGAELMAATDSQRRINLALMVKNAGIECSVPARKVAVGAGSKFADWYIDCDEGSHVLKIDGAGEWTVYGEVADSGAASTTSEGGEPAPDATSIAPQSSQ